MTLKEYQQEVIDEFGRWYGLLKEERARADKAMRDLEKYAELDEKALGVLRKDASFDLARVWKDFNGNTGRGWRERKAPGGHSIPHVCIKVPTGGGKTRMAAAMLQRIGKGRGLVLWMVPSDAIMQQTRAILQDKSHWVRQTLDIASGNRTKILKKDARFSREDLRDHLCVMPIMQQAANRIDREFLKITRSSGAYSEFFPDADETERMEELRRDHPGLDMVDGTDTPRTSLVNVFRITRPVVILDEAHKAAAANFGKWAEFVNKLGPGLVIELSATPNEGESNIVKTVTGRELRDEQMIKKNIVVSLSRQSWRGVLQKAVGELKGLDGDAVRNDVGGGGRYLRPIMVIRVERTDPDLHGRDADYVHAFDARDHLVNTLGIPSEQVAIKSSTVDDLKGQLLMEKASPVRYIITRNALMEGWDCPFAYVLVILDNLKSQRALTQLLGRIMRQPYTEYADKESLNDCYVHCIHDDSERVIRMIRQQLDDEGLTDMKERIVMKGDRPEKRTNTRRTEFQKLEIYLPTVSHKEGGGWTDVDYEKHILSGISWDGITVRRKDDPDAAVRGRGATVRIDTVTGGYEYVSAGAGVGSGPRLSEWVSLISEIVPNSWQAARMVREFWAGLSAEHINMNATPMQDELLEEVRRQVIDAAESVFKRKLGDGTIRFGLHAPSAAYRMRGEYETLPEEGDILQRRGGRPVQMSLDEPVYKEDFDSNPERKFARYLDEARAIEWWHRVAARNRGEYYLRGWQRNRIYPDFIAMFGQDDERIFRIYEVKGRHLDNADTEYKRKVLELLGETLTAGNLRVTDGLLRGDFKIVFDDEVDDPAKTGLVSGESARAAHLMPVDLGSRRKKGLKRAA